MGRRVTGDWRRDRNASSVACYQARWLMAVGWRLEAAGETGNRKIENVNHKSLIHQITHSQIKKAPAVATTRGGAPGKLGKYECEILLSRRLSFRSPKF